MSHRSSLIGGYETAAAVLIIIFVSLSAFFIYRAFKGQRRERGSEDNTKETTGRSGENQDGLSESTESGDGSSEDSDVDSRKTITPSPKKNIKEPVSEPFCSCINCTTIGKVDHVTCRREDCDAAESISVRSDLFAYQDNGSTPSEDKTKNSVKEFLCDDEESEIEEHVDVDEPSETESAQEILEAQNLPVQKCQSVEDLSDNTLLAQEIISQANEEDLVVTDTLLTVLHKTNMDELGVPAREFGRSLPLMNNLDSVGYDEHSDLKVKPKINVFNGSLQTTVGNTDDHLTTQEHLSKTLDHILSNPPQNYLGFTVPGLHGVSVVPLQLSEQNKEKMQVIKADTSEKKNEISIMESIMDSNEWLSIGPPDTRDMLWLTQTKTGYGSKANISSSPISSSTSFDFLAEEVMSHQDETDMPEDTTTTAVAKDEMDLLKKVGTVSPMPQLVQVSFRVHYITHSPKQTLAVTGNQQELGFWKSFVPLRRIENGFWLCTTSLPLDSQVEWKFILVEEGKIQRWEECENRCFTVTGQREEVHLNKNWGYA